MIATSGRLAAAALAAATLITAPTWSTSSSPHTAPATAHQTVRTAATSRPNIVFVLTDDLSWDLVKYMPHVVQLQRRGATMQNFYVVDSLCCPSRASIFTGQYPHDTGVYTNALPDGGYDVYNSNGDEAKTFALPLQRAGYRTGFMGKYLNLYQPADSPAPGWDEWDVAGNGYAEFDYTLRQDDKQVYYAHDASDYLTDVINARGRTFIRSSASAGKPFFLELATFSPHIPANPAPRDKTLYTNATVPRTPRFDKVPINPPSWMNFPPLSSDDIASLDKQYVKRLQSIQSVDKMIGDVEQTLVDAGVADNTYIVFGSDNGYHMGDYRLMPGKKTAYDTDIHVPLIVTGPHIPAGSQIGGFGTNIDLAPTFEHLADASVPSTVEGVSLAPLWFGEQPSDWQNAVLVEHHQSQATKNDPDGQGTRGGDPPDYRALRTQTALYVHYASGEIEYYDLVNDPYELHNLAKGGRATGSLRNTIAPLETALQELAHCHTKAACKAAAHIST